MALNFRGFNLSEHVTCEKPFFKLCSWVKDTETQVSEVQEGFRADFGGYL